MANCLAARMVGDADKRDVRNLPDEIRDRLRSGSGN